MTATRYCILAPCTACLLVTRGVVIADSLR
jgi:hypothetical protein